MTVPGLARKQADSDKGKRDNSQLPQFHTDVEAQQCSDEGILGHAKIRQHTRKTHPVQQAKTENDHQAALVQGS